MLLLLQVDTGTSIEIQDFQGALPVARDSPVLVPDTPFPPARKSPPFLPPVSNISAGNDTTWDDGSWDDLGGSSFNAAAGSPQNHQNYTDDYYITNNNATDDFFFPNTGDDWNFGNGDEKDAGGSWVAGHDSATIISHSSPDTIVNATIQPSTPPTALPIIMSSASAVNEATDIATNTNTTAYATSDNTTIATTAASATATATATTTATATAVNASARHSPMISNHTLSATIGYWVLGVLVASMVLVGFGMSATTRRTPARMPTSTEPIPIRSPRRRPAVNVHMIKEFLDEVPEEQSNFLNTPSEYDVEAPRKKRHPFPIDL